MDFGKLTPDQERIRNLVVQHANDMGVDPELAQAVAYEESQFNPYAISPNTKHGRSYGVMQVNQNNFHNLGLSKENVHMPEKNIPAGMRILKENLDRFGGHENAALAAYNSNPHYAENYVKNNYNEKFLPKETQDYLKKISAKRGQTMAQDKEPDLSRFGPQETKGADEDLENRLKRFEPAGGSVPMPDFHVSEPVEDRPKYAGQSELFKKTSQPFRDSSGDISPLYGAPLGVGTAFIPPTSKSHSDAVKAYEAAKGELDTARRAATEHIGGQKTNLAKLETDFQSKQSNLAKIEAELREAMKSHKETFPTMDEIKEAAKAKRTGVQNYTVANFGEIPENYLQEVEDTTRGQNPRQKGAWDVAAKVQDRNAVANMLGAKDMEVVNGVMRPKAEAQTAKDSLANLQKQSEGRVSALQQEADLARQQAKSAENLHALQTTNLSKAETNTARDLSTLSSKAQTAYAEKPTGLRGMVSKIAGTPVVGRALNAFAGAGVGMSTIEAQNRYEKGDIAGAVRIALAGVLDALSLMPAGTPITAAIKGIGLTGGLAVHVLDAYLESQKEKAAKPKARPPQVQGGLTRFQTPSRSTTAIAQDASGRYHM